MSSALAAAERERITMRVPKSMRSTLEEAASLSGATVNQFIMKAAYDEAQRMLERERVIRLSRADVARMFELMESPPKPSRKMRQALRAFKKNVHA
jgi:uncharacterized protein (DUF1778 family)